MCSHSISKLHIMRSGSHKKGPCKNGADSQFLLFFILYGPSTKFNPDGEAKLKSGQCFCFAEKELVLEIERLKRKNGPGVKKNKIPSKLDAFIRGIEEERDYYKQQTDILQRMLRGEPGSLPKRSTSKPSSRCAREKADKKVWTIKQYLNTSISVIFFNGCMKSYAINNKG